jgi:diguanylate cyclase (GGDEF)-like protein
VRIRNLQTRIIIAFSILLLVVQMVVFGVVNHVISDSANQDIDRSLAAGERLFHSLREDNTKSLAQSASILTSDFAFIKATATTDHNTIVSVLQNHGARIHADISMMVGPNNVVIADTLNNSLNGKQFPFPHLIETAEQEGQTTSIVFFDGKLYQLVVVPVLAPLPIAWLALGFEMDDQFAKNLKTLTGLEVSFIAPNANNGKWQVLASTLSTEHSVGLSSHLREISSSDDASVKVLHLANEDYVTRVAKLQVHGGKEAVAVLQQSLDIVLAPLHRLQNLLLVLSGLALLATLFASYRIARNISRPLRELGSIAQDIEQGKYQPHRVIQRDDEIGQLAAAFQHMAGGIAQREEKISELAYRDSLTGLANRTSFSIQLQAVIDTASANVNKEASQFSVLLMDIDRFKEVNDILGHHIGDLLLKEIVKRLCTNTASNISLIARLGGDEFGILLAPSDTQNAHDIAGQIQDALDLPILLEGHQVIASGSIGIVTYPTHGEHLNALLRHAELAMYASKRSNSGFVVYDASLENNTQQNLSLMAELRYAVEHDEFKLFYQPKVNIATGTVSQVEALVRWIHPKRGIIAPDNFIPFAESTGFIGSITQWVIAHALAQRSLWQEKALPLKIAINISARDLLNPKLPALFVSLMQEYSASPDWLSLEITESAIMTDPKSALDVLNQLYKLGLSMSIDDFGTGYSSLAYLKKLPVNELKIDKSFITDMENNLDDSTIVRSTIDLGHNMGLKVIAEGVENKATWDALETMGCDLVQGYYVSRPLSPEILEQWLSSSQWKFCEDKNA